MIKNPLLRISSDQRDKITTGEKSEKGYPKSLDYFNIEKFPELQVQYGLKPTNFIVYCPSSRIADFFDDNMVLWAGLNNPVKRRSCDGETCIHRIEETLEGHKYGAGEETPCVCKALNLPDMINKNGKDVQNPDKCKYSAYLKVYIASPQTGKVEHPLCYVFQTSSVNSGSAVRSELEKVLLLNGGMLLNVPFSLSVNMVSGKNKAQQKFPIWSMRVIGSVADIRGSRALTEGFTANMREDFLRLPGATATVIDDAVIDSSSFNPLFASETYQKASGVIASAKSAKELALIISRLGEVEISVMELSVLKGEIKARATALGIPEPS